MLHAETCPPSVAAATSGVTDPKGVTSGGAQIHALIQSLDSA
jgi:hypothetical protein